MTLRNFILFFCSRGANQEAGGILTTCNLFLYNLIIITNKINLFYLCTNYLTFCSYKRCQFSQRITTQHIRLLEGQGCRDHRNIKMSQVQIYFYFPKISIKKSFQNLVCIKNSFFQSVSYQTHSSCFNGCLIAEFHAYYDQRRNF